MAKQNIINGFLAGELSPAMDMRSDLKGTKYGVRQAENWIPTFQGPIGTRDGTIHFDYQDIAWCTRTRAVQMSTWNARLVFWLFESSTNEQIRVYLISDSWVAVDTIPTAELGTKLDADIEEYTVLQPPGLEELWFFHENVAPWRIYDNGVNDWRVADIVFTGAPAEWTENPQTACFFQGRLYVAGSAQYSHIFWASEVDSYKVFTGAGTAVNPDDAMKFELPDPVAIHWMEGMKNLILGSDQYEYIVTAVDGVVMPGDIQVQKQSNYGSCRGPVTVIGSGVLYRSIDRKKLRIIKYDWREDQWISKNLLFASEHLVSTDDTTWRSSTLELRIDEMAYHPIKEQILCVLNNGQVLIGLYEATDQTMGWTPLTYFEEVKSAQVVRQSEELYMTVLASQTYDSTLTGYGDTFNIMYYNPEDIRALDNTYQMDPYVSHSALMYPYHELTEVIEAAALTGRSDLTVVYEDAVTGMSEIWESDAANLVGTSIYHWVASANTTITNVSHELVIVALDTSEITAQLAISTASDFTSNVEAGERYIFSCEAKASSSLGMGFMVWVTTADLSNPTAQPEAEEVKGFVGLTEDWVTFTSTYKADYGTSPSVYVLFYTDPWPTAYLRNFSFKKITSETDIVVAKDQTLNGSDEYSPTMFAKNIYIGIPYTCTLETLPINREEQTGDTHSNKKRWSKAYIRTINSYPVSIEGRDPNSYTEGTRDQQVTMLGWDTEATITITQAEPYKSVIAGIFGEVVQNAL